MPTGDAKITDSGAVINVKAYRDLDEFMHGIIQETGIVDASDIVASILAASTADEVMGGDVIQVEEFVPEDEITLVGNLRAQPSKVKDSKTTKYYLVADVMVNGFPETLVTSSVNCVAQLIRLAQLEAYPFGPCRMRKSVSSNGFDVYRFVKIRKRVRN